MLLRHRFQPDGFKLNYIDFTHKSHGPAQAARSSLSGNDLVVHFPTYAGAQYRVMTSTDLSSWVEAGTVTGNGSEASMAVPFPETSAMVFARVVEF